MSADRLTPLDATFLELEEADDGAHMHIGSLMVLEARPGTPRSWRACDSSSSADSGRSPPLPPFTAAHRRADLAHLGGGPGFSIEDHVRRAELPSPGDRAALLDWAGHYWSERIDRHRPLWDACLVTGLEGGRWAIASKTHHALVDGVGAVGVAHLVLDTSRRPRRADVPAEFAAPEPEEHGGPL